MSMNVAVARERRRAAWSVAAIGAGGIVATAVQLLVGVVSARALAPDGRGTLALLLAWGGLASHVAVFGFEVVLARAAARLDAEVRQIVGSICLYALPIGLLAGLVHFVSKSNDEQQYLLGSVSFALFVASSAASVLLQAVLVGLGRYGTLAYLRVILPVLILGGYTLLWIAQQKSPNAFFAFYAGVSCLFSLLMSNITCGVNTADWSPSSFKRCAMLVVSRWREAMAAGVGNFLRAAETALPVVVLGFVADARTVGLFAVAGVICSVQSLVGDAFARHAFGTAASGSAAGSFALSTVGLVQLAAAVIAVPVGYVALPWVYGAEFSPARSFLPFLAAAGLAGAMATVAAERLRGLGLSSHLILPRLLAVGLIVGSPMLLRNFDPVVVVALSQLGGGLVQLVAYARVAGRAGPVVSPGIAGEGSASAAPSGWR
jgi:O-antigen/teichoic acid export membrane protein